MGGAITSRDRRKVLQVVKVPEYKPQSQPDMAFTQEGHPVYKSWSEPTPFGIPTDMSYRASQTPASDLMPKFMRDEHVLAHLKSMTKDGKKARDHHPAVQQSIVHSLKAYPELLTHYIHS